MKKQVIEAHKFEEAKKNLQVFSEKTKTTYSISKVKSNGGLFGLGNHKVTGDELNNIIKQIQDYLIKANECAMETIDEFFGDAVCQECLSAAHGTDEHQVLVPFIKLLHKSPADSHGLFVRFQLISLKEFIRKGLEIFLFQKGLDLRLAVKDI